jgi:pimeloyl-ACP methyl ester carboxylesterase
MSMSEDLPVRIVRVPTNGIHLNCAVSGEGPLLLLLHGFPEFWGSWYRQIPALGEHFTVVAPDLRGCGDSDKPKADYAARTLADDILGVIDALGDGQPARVVGHDWGGFVAWSLSYHAPERLSRLSILNSPHPYLYRKKMLSDGQFLRSWYIAFFLVPVLSVWFLRRNGGAGLEQVFKSAAGRYEALSKAYIADAKAEMLKPDAISCSLKYYRAAFWRGRKNVEFMNAVTDVPIQIIWGVKDPVLGPALLDGMERYAPNLQVHRLEDVGHWVNHEAADDVCRLLLDWHVPETVVVTDARQR